MGWRSEGSFCEDVHCVGYRKMAVQFRGTGQSDPPFFAHLHHGTDLPIPVLAAWICKFATFTGWGLGKIDGLQG
jgi:hypothetical protein